VGRHEGHITVLACAQPFAQALSGQGKICIGDSQAGKTEFL